MSLFISVDAAASPRKLNSTCTLNAGRTLSFHFHSELEIEEQMPRLFFAWRLPSNMLLDFLYWPHLTTFGAVRVFPLLADSCFREESSSCSASILSLIHNIPCIASFLLCIPMVMERGREHTVSLLIPLRRSDL